MLSPSLMFQEALGGHGVLGPPKGHEVQGGPIRGDKTYGALELTVTSHLASSLLPYHLQSQILGLTEGPGSPFFPGSPGPPPPAICPGSPCVRQKAVLREGRWKKPFVVLQFLACFSLVQGLAWGTPTPPGNILAPFPFHLPVPPLGLEALVLPMDKAE